MKTTYYLIALLFLMLSACSENETPKDVPFEMMPDGLKKSIEAELIEKMENEVIAYHKEMDEQYSSVCAFWPCDIEARNFLDITRDSSGAIVRQDEIYEKEKIESLVRNFYLTNESLSAEEVIQKIQNPLSENYDFPFYSLLTKSEILKEIKKNTRDLDRAKKEEEEDFIVFYQDLVSKWEQKLEAIEALDTDELLEIHPQAQVRINDHLNQEGLSVLTTEVLKGLLQVRDFASIKYFNLPYIELYFEATRSTDSKADEKLNAINFLYPTKIMDFSYAKSNNLATWYMPVKPPRELSEPQITLR